MRVHFLKALTEYPSRFWLMCVGLLISSAGASMIWPLLMIYASEKLGLSLSATSTQITINASTSLVSSFAAGTVVDKMGRKLVRVASLAFNGLGYLFLSQAHSYWGFALLMVLISYFSAPAKPCPGATIRLKRSGKPWAVTSASFETALS
jgi:MFS family permease